MNGARERGSDGEREIKERETERGVRGGEQSRLEPSLPWRLSALQDQCSMFKKFLRGVKDGHIIFDDRPSRGAEKHSQRSIDRMASKKGWEPGMPVQGEGEREAAA